jgi:beta-glucosidase
MVLVRNDGLLPLDPAALSRVAVIGQSAAQPRTQGGGSATVVPDAIVSPLDGLRAALPRAEVTHATGAVVPDGVAGLPLDRIRNPVTGEPGARARFLDAGGRELFAEDRRSTALVYIGAGAPISTAHTFELTTIWSPGATGPVRIGFAAAGRGTVHLDGAALGELSASLDAGADPAAALLGPPSASLPIEVEAGRSYEFKVLFDLASREGELAGAFAITVGVEPDDRAPDALLAEAVAAAEASDVAVVVVGTSSKVESEGHDRTDLVLPGRQDELVEAVAATGTPTVVVVNSGSPVELPWRDQVAAVVLGWFGGQQMGEALAEVLTGVAEPGGRLPTTWPARTGDVPVLNVTPAGGKLHYGEGIHVGYRAWLRAGAGPAYAFGHGLGYTTWSLTDLVVVSDASPSGDAGIEVTVANTGHRPGKQVVQVYLARPETSVDRPVRWLAASAVVRLSAGQRRRVPITVPARAFAHWEGAWRYEPGSFVVAAGTSIADLPLSGSVVLRA